MLESLKEIKELDMIRKPKPKPEQRQNFSKTSAKLPIQNNRKWE